jgi:hypothetical protein
MAINWNCLFIVIKKEDDGYYHLYDNLRKEYCDKIDTTMIRSKSFDTALHKAEKYIQEFIIQPARDDLRIINTTSAERMNAYHLLQGFL